LLAHALSRCRQLGSHARDVLALQGGLAYDLFDPAHGAGDSLAGRLLLLGGRRDCLHFGDHLLNDAPGLIRQRGAEVRFFGCLLGRHHRGVRGGLQARDHRLDLCGRLPGAARQLLDLLRHGAETPAVLAGAFGLNRGVERQQMDLIGQICDDVDDIADSLALPSQGDDVLGHVIHCAAVGLDGRDRFFHSRRTFLRRGKAGLSAPGNLVGRVPELVHRAGDL